MTNHDLTTRTIWTKMSIMIKLTIEDIRKKKRSMRNNMMTIICMMMRPDKRRKS